MAQIENPDASAQNQTPAPSVVVPPTPTPVVTPATTPTATPSTVTTSPTPDSSYLSLRFILIALIFMLLIFAGLFWWKNYLSQNNNSLQPAENIQPSPSAAIMSGQLDINGVIPEGAILRLVANSISNDTGETFSIEMTPQDRETWHFDGAIPGESYLLQAILLHEGVELAHSSPQAVSAPASNVTLTMNVESEEPPRNSPIVGDIVVNGYIPPNSTISVEGRKIGSTQFTTVASQLTAAPRQIMSYNTAQAGTTYEVQGTLYAPDGKTVLGGSNILTVTAPAIHEVLTINSSAPAPTPPPPTAQPTAAPNTMPDPTSTPTPTPVPAPKAVISGKINFNGIAPPNSRIVILAKVYNTDDYQVKIDNVRPVDGVTWTWRDPAPSTWYDVIAVLKQKQDNGSDVDISTSAMASVAAPATNVSFTLNSGFNLSAPNGNIIAKCGTLSGDTWGAQIEFEAQHNAVSYWYQLGTSNGGAEVFNSTQNASGKQPVTIAVPLRNGDTYYARYAISTLGDLSVGSRQFSPFSATKQLKCGG